MIIQGDKLSFFQELYEKAKTANSKVESEQQANYDQYIGKPIGSERKEQIVRPMTYELVESQISSYIPRASVTPEIRSRETTVNAQAIERLLDNIKNKLPYEKMNDQDERNTYIYGGSVWLVEWDETITTHNTSGDVSVSVLSPKYFVGQPNVYDVDEMEYCFIHSPISKDEVVRRFNVDLEAIEAVLGTDEDIADIVFCYYKNDYDLVCQFAWIEDLMILDIDDYFSRRKYVCKNCNKTKALCKCEKPEFEEQRAEYEEIDSPIIRSNGSVLYPKSEKVKNGRVVMEEVIQQATNELGEPIFDNIGGMILPQQSVQHVPKLERTQLPYYKPNKFPIVIRKNVSREENLFGQSDCEIIRDQQQAANEIETRIMKKLMKAGVKITVPLERKGKITDDLYDEVLPIADPAEKALYSAIDMQTSIQQDVMQADRLYDQAKRILGISDSFQGQQDYTATSGYAKQIQVQQSQGRLESKRKMKNAAYADIDAIIFQLYLAYADEPRMVTFRDNEGNLQNAQFNRYDFLERDLDGEYYYNDSYLFATDPGGDIESNRALIWQENRINFQQGAYGMPQSTETLLTFWELMERSHYPHASDMVAKLRKRRETEIQMQQMQQLKAMQQQGQLPQQAQMPAEIPQQLTQGEV